MEKVVGGEATMSSGLPNRSLMVTVSVAAPSGTPMKSGDTSLGPGNR